MGQLGLGDTNNRGDNANEMYNNLPFVDVGTSLSVNYMALGKYHTCVHLSTNQLKCWGYNYYGQLGLGDSNHRGDNANEMGTNLPIISLGSSITMSKVVLGANHNCVLFTSKKVKCFGDNQYGQLGYGDTNNKGDGSGEMGDSLLFVDFGTSVLAASVHTSSTANHNCIKVDSTNKMKCWGYNNNYQLGYGDQNNRGDGSDEMGSNLADIDLGTVDSVSQIILGEAFTCALRTDALLKCFGLNGHGQLGIGSTTTVSSMGSSLVSASYDSGKTISKMSAGQSHFCILYTDLTTVKCIGLNGNGQLGQGDTTDRGTTTSNTFDKITAIGLGTSTLQISNLITPGQVTCIIFTDVTIKCFGSGAGGGLGNGNTNDIGDGANEMGSNLAFVSLFEPTTAPTRNPTKRPSVAPTFTPTKAPTKAPTKNPTKNPTRNPTKKPTLAPTFAPSTQVPTASPTLVATKKILTMCIGSMFGCAVFDNDEMKCWGSRISWGDSFYSSDAYGDTLNTIGNRIPYLDLGTSVSINQITCGYEFVCLITSSNNMKCLGVNDHGQIGLGTTNDPVGSVTGYKGDSLPYVNVGTGLSVIELAHGEKHTCARLTGNKVKCIGKNNYGQLGIGDASDRGSIASDMGDNLSFVNFGSNFEAASIHSGIYSDHNCVILSVPVAYAQRVKCWGHNNHGQLGYGDMNNRGDESNEMGANLPLVNFGTESKVSQIAIGGYHTCVLLINGNLKCFGYGEDGELGSGSMDDILSTGNTMPVVEIDSGRTISFVTAGEYHICIAYDDMATMKCFGDNSMGQLGQGDEDNRGDNPTTIIPFIPAIQLGVGSKLITSMHSGAYFNCVRFNDDSIKCFGDSYLGQLAIGSSSSIGDEPGEMGVALQYAQLFTSTKAPTLNPTKDPTKNPTAPTYLPTKKPTKTPTNSPTKTPTRSPVPPTPPTNSPTNLPSKVPIVEPTVSPTLFPVRAPTTTPSAMPSNPPTTKPTENPTTASPTSVPTVNPTPAPTLLPSASPTASPSLSPTNSPTNLPTHPPTSSSPIEQPTNLPVPSPAPQSTTTPTIFCNYATLKECKADVKCEWKKVKKVKSCKLYDCSRLKKKKCAKQSEVCVWSKNENLCKLIS